MNTTITAVDLRKHISDILNRVAIAHERIAITRHRKAIAYVISAEDMELLEQVEDQIDLKLSRKALEEAKRKGTISWEKVKKDIKR